MEDVFIKSETRIRYESVDISDNTKKASSFTDRLKLGVGSNRLFGSKFLSAYLELTDVHVRSGKHNNTSNGETEYAEIIDPEQSRLTQSYIGIKPMDGLLITSGRQALNFDNQRFIGDIGWRHMQQTYNSYLLSANNNNIGLDLAYITKVNTIFADKKETEDSITHGNAQENNRSIIVRAIYKASDDIKAVGYAHFSDTVTYGYFAAGKTKLSNNLTINFRIEHATQFNDNKSAGNDNKSADNDNKSADNDNKSADNTYEASVSYYNLEVGMNLYGYLANINYERLNSKSGKNEAFSTSLASKHRHNGWADKFLTTPEDGLVDLNLMLGYKSKKFGEFKMIYHDFNNEKNHADYGDEIDISYVRAIPGLNDLTGTLKYAKYTSKGLSVDTTKIWAMLEYKFSIG